MKPIVIIAAFLCEFPRAAGAQSQAVQFLADTLVVQGRLRALPPFTTACRIDHSGA